MKNLRPPAKPDERPIVLLIREDANGLLYYRYEGHNAPISALVRQLASQLRAPVTDDTRLSGAYDFSLSYSLDTPFGGLQPDPNVPSIFTALDRELGLKLTAGTGVVPVWAIQRAVKPRPD